MEADRPQENRPRWLFKGLLMGVLILVALGLGVSLVGPGGAGGGPGSGPGEEPVVAGGGEALRKESLEDGPGRTPQPAGSRQGDAAGAAGAAARLLLHDVRCVWPRVDALPSKASRICRC